MCRHACAARSAQGAATYCCASVGGVRSSKRRLRSRQSRPPSARTDSCRRVGPHRPGRRCSRANHSRVPSIAGSARDCVPQRSNAAPDTIPPPRTIHAQPRAPRPSGADAIGRPDGNPGHSGRLRLRSPRMHALLIGRGRTLARQITNTQIPCRPVSRAPAPLRRPSKRRRGIFRRADLPPLREACAMRMDNRPRVPVDCNTVDHWRADGRCAIRAAVGPSFTVLCAQRRVAFLQAPRPSRTPGFARRLAAYPSPTARVWRMPDRLCRGGDPAVGCRRRWPANSIHDLSPPCPQSRDQQPAQAIAARGRSGAPLDTFHTWQWQPHCATTLDNNAQSQIETSRASAKARSQSLAHTCGRRAAPRALALQ